MLSKTVNLLTKATQIAIRRVRVQGLRTTMIWAYVRGMDRLTGAPILRFSRITPEIYVGGQIKARGKRHLQNNGIRSSVNMRIEHDDAEHGVALDSYCYLPTVDDNAPTMKQLETGVQFIRSVIDGGGKVFIHCAGGIGRAPTMAAAYFISQGMTPEEAVSFIEQRRPFIYVMPPQWELLHAYAEQQRQAVSV